MRHSPAELNYILHCYYSPEPYPGTIPPNYFVRDGILEERDGGVCRLTPRGMAWVEMILSTPYPEHAFIDPRTSERVASQ